MSKLSYPVICECGFNTMSVSRAVSHSCKFSRFNPSSTTRSPYPENIYSTLTRLGWKHAGGNSRMDVYKKRNWMITLSKTVSGYMFFNRTGK